MTVNSELILNTFKQSTSIYEVIRKLNLPNKGKTSKYIKNILLESGITEDEINQKKFLKTHIVKYCKHCGKKFFVLKVGKRKNQTFCSRSCANHRACSEETKQKIKNSILNENNKKRIINKSNSVTKNVGNIVIEKICPVCGKQFYKRTLTCSIRCGHVYRVKMHPITVETREKLSQKAKKLVAEGKHKGWTTRNIESYPEKFFKKVLENNNIDYEFNKPVTKNELGIQENGCYFLDFALKNNIDLEIDGKQHLVKERHQHDIVRDNRLKKNGWKVYRIAWKALPKNNEYIKAEIDKFIKWYKENC